MINLIPPKAKKNLLVEYWVRVLAVWLILWGITLLVNAGLLWPVYVLVDSQTDAYEISAQLASEKVLNYENASTELVRASQQARYVVDESQISKLSTYITLLQNLQGEGVEFNRISITRGDQVITPISLSGVAESREALAAFRDRLLADEQIETVDLPINNLARDRDIGFSITITLATD